ncbi:MAG: hypothetical protein NT165_02575 [Candidatus Falkowbacteria bacterium]|nr:hypothetical protein [Candidatus Falkowbacteria bacterium]
MEQGTKTDQKKLKSIEYLEQNKVAAKRVYIPTIWHETGRWADDGKWIPTMEVIIVNRSPVTREWTKDPSTGTSQTQQQITVESSNSIGFSTGITVTASVPEEDASKFLYWYSGKSIAEVLDNNVRSFVADFLTSEFGKRELTACQKERAAVFTLMKDATRKWFSERGLRIDNIGASGEFTYLNEEIQNAINLEFIAEKKNDAAGKEVLAAQKYASAAEAIKAQKRLDAEINLTNAMADYIRAGKITWPTTLVIGQGMSLMDIWGVKNLGGQSVANPVTTKKK